MMYDIHRFNRQKKSWLRENNKEYKKALNVLQESNKPSVDEMSLEEIDFTVFDLETTGFFPRIGDEVVSIGATKININNIQFPEHFYEVVRPSKNIPAEILRLTGLTRKKINNGIEFPLAFSNFINFSHNTVLVAHPASFDVIFLKEMAKRWEFPPYSPVYIDSYEIAQWLYPEKKNGLDQLLKQFNIEQKERHHALNDASMTASIFSCLIKDLKKQGITSYQDWINIKKSRRK